MNLPQVILVGQPANTNNNPKAFAMTETLRRVEPILPPAAEEFPPRWVEIGEGSFMSWERYMSE